MKKNYNISIVAANYNNGQFIGEFIDSIINSTMHPHELIIADDGSTDNSLKILDNYKHLSFLKVIKFAENKGFTAALNKGIETASGKYIMRADPDDIMLPDRVEKQYNYLEAHDNIDVVGSNAVYFNSDTKQNINQTNFPVSYAEIKKTYLKGEHGVLHATVCAKTYLFKKYKYGHIFPAEDYDIFARMIKDGNKFANMPEMLYKIRVHTRSSTSNIKLSDIKQTFEFRDKIFGTNTSNLKTILYFNYIRFYRKYQLTHNIILRYIYLLFAVCFYPQKLIKRLNHNQQ